MHPTIAAHRTEIEALCRRFHVKRLEVFGSAARGDFDPERSDADFLVELDKEASESLFDDYMDLKFGLEELLGRSVDLVMPGAISNPYFRAAIEADRRLLYAT
jgi:predicted nucleotidyltransferase